MSIKHNIKQLALTAAILVPGLVQAGTINFPALDIQDMGTDTGASVSASSFSIDATAFSIVDGSNVVLSDIADVDFDITSTSGSYDAAADGGLGYGTFGGTFTVGGGLLSGSFSLLEVFGFGDNINFDFEADLIFNSGSLMGGFTTGRIEGLIAGGGVLEAKLGEVAVVPVPAAVWLFGSGLLGLVGVARRKTA